MNRIILIGNGFDLAHNLKTSYKDFIDDFWEKEREKFEFDTYNKSSYEDAFIRVQIYSNTGSFCKEKGYIWFKTLHDESVLKIEHKNIFLENISEENTLQNWVDIETEYFRSLNMDFNDKKTVENLNKEFSTVQKELEDYLKQIINNPPDLLKQIEQNIYLKPSREIMEIIEDIKYVNILFLNFNYTNTESLYKKNLLNDNEIDIIHIHGELDSPSNPIIFGYGDDTDKKYKHIEDKNENEFLEKIKSIKYLETDNYKKLLTFIDSDKYEIFIMGHSCGISDRTLLNTLFEHENCLSIKIFYHKREDGSDDFSDVARNISRNFTNKQIMRKKVVDKTNSVPLSCIRS